MEVHGKSYSKRKVMNDFVEGYGVAMQLQAMIYGDVAAGEFSDELVAKILKSFDEMISALSSYETATAVEGYSGWNQEKGSCGGFAPAMEGFDWRLEDSGGRRKSVGTYCKNKRGCFKRTRKLQTWSVVSDKLEDAFAWRKYGQKEILNAKFPRSYFRCTHKNTEGCKALKQVQKLQDEPQSYQITYLGSHSCVSEPTKTEPEPDKTEPLEMNISSFTSNSSFIFTNPMVKKQEETTRGDHGNAFEDAGDLSLVWSDILHFEDFWKLPMYSCNEAMDLAYGGHFNI